MKKNIYCTIDTETVGGAIFPKGAYNYGGVIHDKIGNILATFSILVMSLYDDIKNDGYAKKNFYIYQDRMEKGYITCVSTEAEAVAIIRNLCKMYRVKYIQAYNSGFDFNKTMCKELLNDFEFIDIYLMALQTITHLKKYRDFCLKNNFLSSSKKSCSTSAETVYAFITNNEKYKEEHTALSDALIEKDIFIHCDKMHKKYTKNVHQQDCRENKCFPRI